MTRYPVLSTRVAVCTECRTYSTYWYISLLDGHSPAHTCVFRNSSSDPSDRKTYLPSSTMESNQLGMPADPHAGGLRPMPPMPAYPQHRTDPYAPFNPFQPPTQHQPQHQPQPPSQPPPPPQPQPPPHNPISPPTTRKRRSSESENMAAMPQLSSPPGPVFSESRYAVPGPSDTEQPPPNTARKKSRTNTPWTPAEEQRLKTMRDAGQSWSEIAKVIGYPLFHAPSKLTRIGKFQTFPTRTEGSVKKHYYKVSVL